MKKIFTIGLLSIILVACSNSKQLKCSDDTVQSTLKRIFAENVNRDTNEISISAIRTISNNEEFKSCECAATLTAEGKKRNNYQIDTVVTSTESKPEKIGFDQAITYKAQLTDDGKEVNVELHQNE